MSVYQSVNIGFDVVGDGVSTDQTINVSKVFDGILGNTPFTLYPAGQIVVLKQPVMNYTSGLPSSPVNHVINGTAEVFGTIVIITWDSPPPITDSSVAFGGASMTLGY